MGAQAAGAQAAQHSLSLVTMQPSQGFEDLILGPVPDTAARFAPPPDAAPDASDCPAAREVARQVDRQSTFCKEGISRDISKRELSTYDEHVVDYWHHFSAKARPNVFEHGGVCMANDGGISDLHSLMYPLQYFYALMVVVFTAANIFMITQANIENLLKERVRVEDRQFLVSRCIARKVLAFAPAILELVEGRLSHTLFFLELAGLYVLVLRAVYFATTAIWADYIYKRENVDFKRWRNVAHLLFWTLPFLSSFSAMRLLYWATPAVIGTEAYNIIYMANQVLQMGSTCRHRMKATAMVTGYISFVCLMMVIGFDAFLVKFRQASLYVNHHDITFSKALGAVIFMFQVLGVVNLNWFVRDRLFQFVFGGEEGNIDIDEVARIRVWEALLAKRVFSHFGMFQGSIVLLGFDDYDFQKLVLDVRDGGGSPTSPCPTSPRPLSQKPDIRVGPAHVPQVSAGPVSLLMQGVVPAQLAQAAVVRHRALCENEISKLRELRSRVDILERRMNGDQRSRGAQAIRDTRISTGTSAEG